MHDGMPYGRNQGQGHSREVDRQSPTGLIYCNCMVAVCQILIKTMMKLSYLYIFVISFPNLLMHYYNVYGAEMTIKGSLHGAFDPHVKRFSAESFPSLVKTGPKMAVFRE